MREDGGEKWNWNGCVGGDRVVQIKWWKQWIRQTRGTKSGGETWVATKWWRQ